jgi:hypothetical protein
MLLLTLLGGWGGLAEAGHPCLDTPHRGSRGLFPTHDPSKNSKSNYSNSIRTNPHPLDYLYISGGVSSPHPPKTIFLRRDILFVRYTVIYGVYIWFWPTLIIVLEKPLSCRVTRVSRISKNCSIFTNSSDLVAAYMPRAYPYDWLNVHMCV